MKLPRQIGSIAKATALEILSEPLPLLVMLVSIVMAVLAPALHYHQFGEATRMARDAGFSALFIGGSVFAVFGTIGTCRREIESGTEDMALAHDISRRTFFLSKALGSVAAYLIFVAITFAVTVIVVEGAFVGGVIADRTGDIARIWGPCFAAGVAIIIVPMVMAALLNRFGNFRFSIAVFVTALGMSILGLIGVSVLNFGLVVAYLKAALPLVAFPLTLLCGAAAFSMRFKSHVAASAVGVLFALLLPFAGNYYLSDAMARGGEVGLGYAGLAILALGPIAMGMLVLGMEFSADRG